MKRFTSTLGALLPAIALMAVVPQEQQPGKDLNPEFTKDLTRVIRQAQSDENQNSFFEGFEGRDPNGYGYIANAWLPTGWTQFSRAGNRHMTSADGFWDLTWLTLCNDAVQHLPSNDQTMAFEGEAFAYIMADVMWGGKPIYPDLGLDYATNHPQDEWLVSPAIKPNPEEWFYFQLQFRPAWCVYNRDADDFTGENTLLEVYVTEGDGTTDSDWKKLWSLKDYIEQKYTPEDLRADLTTYEKPDYVPVYVNVGDYVGKDIKVALRFFGVNGQGMAVDNVSLGIPQPKPSYTLPKGFFKQQSLTPLMTEITGTPQLLIPFDTEATWVNTSADILTNEWSYDDADGSKLTSDIYNLVTPAYNLYQKYDAPVLTGSFESRSETYQTLYSKMQAGGRLSGTGDGYNGELGIAYYDYLDPKCSFAQSSNTISFHQDLNNQWETLLGRMPGTIEVTGIGCVYYATDVKYGFDYVDIFAQVVGDANGKLAENDSILITAFSLPDNEYEAATIIGQSMLTGADINALPVIETGNYKNLRFKFDVPVVSDNDMLVLLSPYNIEGEDKLVFPYLKSEDDKVWGNSVVYLNVYETEDNGGTYDTFYNLNAYPMSKGHFAGLTMSLGAVYSYMETDSYSGETIELPIEGGEYTINGVHSMFGPEKWALTTDRVNKSDWMSFEAAAVDGHEDEYSVTLKFDANTDRPREVEAYLMQPGSCIKLNVRQEGESSGIADITASAEMSVKVVGRSIIVNGAEGVVELFNTTGTKLAQVNAKGTATIDAGGMASGVYIIRNGKSAAKVVL